MGGIARGTPVDVGFDGLIVEPAEPPTAPANDLPNDLLFEDIFADNRAGWYSGDTEIWNFRIADGAFRILGREGSSYLSLLAPATAVGRVGDVRIEAATRRLVGAGVNYHGIISRGQDSNNYYGLVVNGDGWNGIFKLRQGQWTWLASERGESVTGPVRLSAACVGPSLLLYRDGELAAWAEDADMPSGSVGFVMVRFAAPDSDVSYDDFRVYGR